MTQTTETGMTTGVDGTTIGAPGANDGLLKTATRASVSVSVVLVIAKGVAWLMTGSVSVFASLLDSLMDTAASLINMFAVDYSLKPADQDHRFGHGKAEALAGLGQAVFIAFSAGFLLYHAAMRLLEPTSVTNTSVAMWVILFALVITLVLVLFQRHVVRKTGSTAVAADSLHFLSDLVTNVATLVALGLTQMGFMRADSLFGLLIGCFIFYSALKVGWSAVRILMDEELPQADREQVISTVAGAPGVLQVIGLRSWRSGQRRILHIDVAFDGACTLQNIHEMSQQIEQLLLADDPDADVSIHPHPHPHPHPQQTLN